MSLEQALAANTAAIQDLIAIWSKMQTAAPEKAVAAKTEKAAPAPKPEPKPEPKQEAVVAPSEPEAPAAQPVSSPAASSSVDYPTLQKAVFALAGKSREAAAAVAASMGVKTFKELPEGKWAEALAAVTAKTVELEAA